MRHLVLAALLALLQACSTSLPPTLGSSPGPEDLAAPAADAPYRPVIAGTAYHGLGKTPRPGSLPSCSRWPACWPAVPRSRPMAA